MQPNGATPTPSAPQNSGSLPVDGKDNSISVVSMLYGTQCLDMHEPLTQPTVGMYPCHDTAGQTWRLDDEGLLRYAGAKTGPASELCLEPNLDAGKNGGNILVQPCRSTPNQRWTISGYSLIHRETGLCMGIGPEYFETADKLSFPRPVAATCNALMYNQKWFFGARKAALSTWKTNDASRTLRDKCSPIFVVGSYVASDPGTKRFVDRYGSLAATLEAMRANLLSTCMLMYNAGNQVPVIDKITVNFWPASSGPIRPSGWSIRDASGHVLHFDGPTYASLGQDSQLAKGVPVFSVRTEHDICREMLFTLDWRFGKPKSIISGHHVLSLMRLGFGQGYGQKLKGGDWRDSFTTTAYFLKWLDDTYMTKPRPQRFTDMMQVQAQAKEADGQDPNWFDPWVLSQTGGKTLDQLWVQYQASF